MKSSNFVDETLERDLAVIDFLDSLDTDVSMNDIEITEEVNNEIENDNAEDIPSEDTEEPKEEITALVVTKPNSLYVAQNVFKKSIKISIKSFLISLSLGFLNLFL